MGSSALLVTACDSPRDATSPRVALIEPASGAVVDQPQVDVVVQVWDDGSVTGVEVHGQGAASTSCATLGQGRYACPAVPLVLGDNVLTARARDSAGNVGEVSFLVRRVPPPEGHAPELG